MALLVQLHQLSFFILFVAVLLVVPGGASPNSAVSFSTSLRGRKEFMFFNMSRRNGNSIGGSKLDLKLNLSPPRVYNHPQMVSPSRSLAASPTSPPSSCVSLDDSNNSCPDDQAITSMVLVGCPRCLMYVMLAEVNDPPRCPKCKSTCLLDVIYEKK